MVKINNIDLLISSGLYDRISWRVVDYLKKHNSLLDYLVKFTSESILKYINLCDKMHNIKPKISLNSLKLSYKIYQDTKKLFLPIYYRTYYGHWQKSSGACSGLLYWYNDKIKPEYRKDQIFEYMVFERLSDLLKPHTHIIIQEPNQHNLFEAEVWSEND